MSIELLPCPFCGGAAEIQRLGDHGRSTQYACTECGASLETGEEWDHGKRWNERAGLDNERVASLTAERDEADRRAGAAMRELAAFREACVACPSAVKGEDAEIAYIAEAIARCFAHPEAHKHLIQETAKVCLERYRSGLKLPDKLLPPGTDGFSIDVTTIPLVALRAFHELYELTAASAVDNVQVVKYERRPQRRRY